jgi:C1A family cysteine protease
MNNKVTHGIAVFVGVCLSVLTYGIHKQLTAPAPQAIEVPANRLAPGGFSKGLVRAPNKDHLIQLSRRRHQAMLQKMVAKSAPPPQWDSRTKGWIGPIKNQGQCGSCWDFSGTGVVEIAYNLAGVANVAKPLVLSEEYTLCCGKNGGCGGDDNVTVLQWAKATGIPTTADYGDYTASGGRCAFKSTETLYKISDWGFADSGGSSGVTPVADIKAAIMKYGCVGCGVDAGFQDPGTGVISGGGNRIDHDVILVGWDDTKGNAGAWIMRNSWGTSWANGGYAWIEYGAYSIGTESVWAYVENANPPIDWFSRIMPWKPQLNAQIDRESWLALAP